MRTDQFSISVGDRVGSVGAIYLEPADCQGLFVFAHGAGANMRHAFMESLSQHLAEVGIATLRYNFPYMERSSSRPDPPAILEATVRAAIGRACELANGRPIVAGGKSMGGRMTSNAIAHEPDPRVSGLVFVGFPLHQPGKPGIERAAHLHDVKIPMLFLQGTRDTLANLELMKEVCASLGELGQLHVIDTADHSFAVLKRSGKSKEDVFTELAQTIRGFVSTTGH